MKFYQKGGNFDVPWEMLALPDTGCSKSLLALSTVKKYNLQFDNSKAARSNRLLNASSHEMKVAGLCSLQCRYGNKTIHLDCLVVDENIGCSAYISWQDLYELNLIKLPNDDACMTAQISSDTDRSMKSVTKQNSPPNFDLKIADEKKNSSN